MQAYKLNFAADWWKGKKRGPMSQETKDKISRIKMGHKDTEKTRDNKKKAQLQRYLRFEEHKKSSIGQKKRITEGNHNFWKGGVTVSKNYTHYNDYKYRWWRKEVFTRDNYTCQECRVRGVYITAHHIKSWAHHSELRYDVANGVTLCENCHSLTDNYRGKGKRKHTHL